MKHMEWIVGVVGALALLGAGCAGGSNVAKAPQDTSPIKLGWLGPLTGDVSAPGKDALAAAQIAVEEVNAVGGVNGRNIELVVEDGKCTPKDAAAAGSKLINVDKVVAIDGGLCSGETTAVAPLAEQNKVVLFSGCSSAPNITTAGDYIFRSYPSDAYQGKFGAEYVFNTLKKKKVAVLAVLGDWGTGVKDSFIKNFKELGGEIVSAEDYVQDTRDLKTQLTKIKNGQAELVYFVGYTEASNAGLKQAKELGIKLPFFGADAWDDVKVHENSFADGIMYTALNTATKDQAWADKLKAKGASNTTCAPGSYNNIKILADVMKRVGSDPIAIKTELYNIKDFPGVAGPVTLDSNGDVTTASYVVKVVKNKKSEVVAQ